MDRGNAGRALQQLEQAGHIQRRKDDNDKRTNLVQITAQGQKTVVEIARIRSEMAQSFFGELRTDEAALIVALLSKAITADVNV